MLVDLATAKLHLRVMHDSEDAGIAAFLAAAEEQVSSFLNRNVYADVDSMVAAQAGAAADLAAAATARDTAIELAGDIDVWEQRCLAERAAKDAYNAAIEAWRRTSYGMVVNESVRTAILLITASLWEHRGDEDGIEGVPQAARAFLWPHRIGLGV